MRSTDARRRRRPWPCRSRRAWLLLGVGSSSLLNTSVAQEQRLASVACPKKTYSFEGYVDAKPPDACMDPATRLPVVCCKDGDPPGAVSQCLHAAQSFTAFDETCSGYLSLPEAEAYCARQTGGRYRLCGSGELQRNICCKHKCGYDFNQVWTREPCSGGGLAMRKKAESPQKWTLGFPYQYRAHFVHMPKCGGTSLSAVLRRMLCERNVPSFLRSGNSSAAATGPNGDVAFEEIDCCVEPGSCDPPSHRKCNAIFGCHGHAPRMRKSRLVAPGVATVIDGQAAGFGVGSFTLLRHPVSRVLSAFSYRCHNPNSDCYHVRKEFCTRGRTCARTYTIDEYLDMPEYHNIFTRMVARNVFPYSNTSSAMGDRDVTMAKDLLDKFAVVGLQEAYDGTVLLMSEAIEVPLSETDFAMRRVSDGHAGDGNTVVMASYERPVSDPFDFSQRLADTVKGSPSMTDPAALRQRIEAANALDIALYEHVRMCFCQQVSSMVELLTSNPDHALMQRMNTAHQRAVLDRVSRMNGFVCRDSTGTDVGAGAGAWTGAGTGVGAEPPPLPDAAATNPVKGTGWWSLG